MVEWTQTNGTFFSDYNRRSSLICKINNKNGEKKVKEETRKKTDTEQQIQQQ